MKREWLWNGWDYWKVGIPKSTVHRLPWLQGWSEKPPGLPLVSVCILISFGIVYCVVFYVLSCKTKFLFKLIQAGLFWECCSCLIAGGLGASTDLHQISSLNYMKNSARLDSKTVCKKNHWYFEKIDVSFPLKIRVLVLGSKRWNHNYYYNFKE